jgi:hypothetical protein
MSCLEPNSDSEIESEHSTAGPQTAIRSLHASRPLSGLFSESLAGRFARFEPDRVLASRSTGPSTQDFLHKSLGMLNAWLRALLQARACRAVALPAAIVKKTEQRENPCAIGISTRSKNVAQIVALSRRARCRALCLRFLRRKMWCRCALAAASSCKNAGFFTAL